MERNIVRNILCCLVIFAFITCVEGRNMHVINQQSQLRDISEPFTILSIRNYYSSFINNLAPIIGTGAKFLTTSQPLQDYFNVYCVFTSVPSGNLAPNDKSILSNLNSSLCNSVQYLDEYNMPIDAAHYSYLVLNQEPTIIISPNNDITLWSIILKNAMIDQTVRYDVWNFTISEVFKLYPMYDRPTSVEYALDKDIASNREDIVKELEEEIWSDCKLFESVFEIQNREGLGLGFSPISVPDRRDCNSTLYNSTFTEEYHQAILRIDLYLNLILNYSNLVNTTGSLDLTNSTLYFMDNLVGSFNPTLLVEAIRNVLKSGGFNTYLSYSKPSSNYDMNYFTSLQKSDIKPVSQLMVHPYCYSYYNFYASQYYFRDSYLLKLIFNDVIYFGIFSIGIFVFLFNSVSYCLDCKLFVKKRILLPLFGPPTLIVISACYTVFMRSKFSVATYWILVFIAVFPAPILIGTYLVSLFRFSYLKNMDLWQKKIFKSPKIQKHLSSTCTSVIFSIIVTVACLIICLAPIVTTSVSILFSSSNIPQELFILLLAFEVFFMLLIALIFLVVDLVNKGVATIKRKGLGYYFFYDDPFYYRIDLMIMILMMTSVIPIIVGSVEDGTAYFIVRKVFTVVFFVMFYAIIGGTVTIAHWINRFKRLRSKCKDAQVTTLETFLEDQQFREMFRTYSKNEFSMENLIMYEELEKLKKNNKVSPQELKALQDKFLLSSSVHEVNYPSAVKKSFQEFLDSYVDEDVSSNDSDSTTQSKSTNSGKQTGGLPKKGTIMLEKTLELVLPELLKNMFDTFSRMKTTPEFTHWFENKQIQDQELGEEQENKEANV